MTPTFLIGTRPETIKLFPVIREFKSPRVIFSSQHSLELCKTFFSEFKIKPIILPPPPTDNASLSKSVAVLTINIGKKLNKNKDKLVVVQGDTNTALAGAQAAFLTGIPIAHIEAGMRSRNNLRPFPEELNRKLISQLATYHFCPTGIQADNLRSEKIWENVFITGNTVVDSLLHIKNKRFKPTPEVLITLHRREIFGKKLNDILTALNELAEEFPKIRFLFSLHSNPNSSGPAKKILNRPNIFFIRNEEYSLFLDTMDRSLFVMTDSGGIQEECAVLNKPFLILRNETERPEVLKVGKLVGTDPKNIKIEFRKLLKKRSIIEQMTPKFNLDVIGDGNAGKRIADILKDYENHKEEKK